MLKARLRVNSQALQVGHRHALRSSAGVFGSASRVSLGVRLVMASDEGKQLSGWEFWSSMCLTSNAETYLRRR